jgi:two-component system sensor histidine kinase/response regulator
MDPVRILVVDDEQGMRLGVERTLRGFTLRLPDFEDEISFTVTQATSGEEALKCIKDNQPDLMLLDHKMGGMSGLDVLEALGPKVNDILTVMITAYASLETAVTATKRGAYDFLAKPFTPNELKATVRKAANHLLLQRQARRLAEEKRQVRFQFISVLAHELKAPIGAIEGYLGLMKDRTAGDDWDAYDPMIERSVVRLAGMRKLIIDLLDLTRIESGTKKRELVEVDLRELAAESMETYFPDAQKRGITIELHADETVPIMGDSGELQIILNNLISNAVKYNRDDGKVDVTMTQDNGVTTIAVADTGIGMSEEDVAKLFGEFVRIKNAKTRNILGSGLGLSILKKLSQLYGGDVSVTSTPDVGTTFTVTLGATQGDDDAT